MALLTINQIEKTFGSSKVVDEVSFSVEEGDLFGMLGPNGAGKTTTIRMIMGIIEPDAGKIDFRGNIRNKSAKQEIGYLPEERGLYEDTKVIEVLEYLGTLKGMRKSSARGKALDWLRKMDLKEESEVKIKELSKGMGQKVQFIASVIHEPTLAILDEPFAGLDPVNQELFKSIIKELKQGGMTILLSSHRMNMVEELCDKIFMIHNGKKILSGFLSEIKSGFGKDLVNLRFAGDGTLLEDRYDRRISQLTLDDNSASFYIEKGYSPDRFIKEFPDELSIEEISVRKPPLHEIFVETIKGDEDE